MQSGCGDYYHAVFFADPDGLKLEVCCVPAANPRAARRIVEEFPWASPGSAALDTIALDIRRVDRSAEAVMRNLLELYCHDMAEWFLLDANEDGTYAYLPDKVWNDQVHVYVAFHGRIPIGFALIGSAERFVGDPEAKDLDEFFVVRRHRRSGVGRLLASHVWRLYPGRWLVRVFRGNRPALPFWRTTIDEYTDGRFCEEERTVGDRSWSYFTFDRTLRS